MIPDDHPSRCPICHGIHHLKCPMLAVTTKNDADAAEEEVLEKEYLERGFDKCKKRPLHMRYWDE